MREFLRLGTSGRKELARALNELPPPEPPVPRADGLRQQCLVTAAEGERRIEVEYDYRRVGRIRRRDCVTVRCLVEITA